MSKFEEKGRMGNGGFSTFVMGFLLGALLAILNALKVVRSDIFHVNYSNHSRGWHTVSSMAEWGEAGRRPVDMKLLLSRIMVDSFRHCGRRARTSSHDLRGSPSGPFCW